MTMEPKALLQNFADYLADHVDLQGQSMDDFLDYYVDRYMPVNSAENLNLQEAAILLDSRLRTMSFLSYTFKEPADITKFEVLLNDTIRYFQRIKELQE